MNKSQRWLILGIFGLIYFIALMYANRPMDGDFFQSRRGSTETGRIVLVHSRNSDWWYPVEVEILSGPWRGNVVEGEFQHSPAYASPQAGDQFSIEVMPRDDGTIHVLARNPERRGPLLGLIAFFIGALLLLGGKKGLRAISGIGFTLTSIFFLLIPLLVRGYPMIGTTLFIVLIMSVVTVTIIGGSLPKIITAILGTMVGVVFSLFIAEIFGGMAHINGLHWGEAPTIISTTAMTEYGIRGLFTGGILIASLGAVLDTSVAIASAMEEVRIAKPKISPIKLFRSGMNVGRDAMGTMSNTLILAFVGASLNTVIIIAMHDFSLNQILNDPTHAMEILRSLSGSLGIIFAVPAASFIGALLLGNASQRTFQTSERPRRA